MAKHYYDFSLPVKQSPQQVVNLGCQILIYSCRFLIVTLKLYHFIALSAKICIFTNIEVIKYGIICTE